MQPPALPLSDIRAMRIELDSIAREHDTRPKTADRADLLNRARAAVAAAQSLRIPEFSVTAVTRAATLLNHDGHAGEARQLLEAFEPLPSSLRRHPLAVSFGGQLLHALAALARGERDARLARELWLLVDERSSSLIDLIEGFRARVSVPDLFNAYTRFSIDIYSLAVEALVALGRDARALARVELVKCRSIHRLRSGHGAPQDGNALRDEFRQLSRDLDDLQSKGQSPPEVVARRRAIWDLLAIQRFAERADTFTEFDLSAFQSALPADTVAVSWFWLDRERLLTAAITSERFLLDQRQIGESTRSEIDEQARSILTFEDGDSQMRTRLRQSLVDVIFPPAVRHLMADGTRLVLSPHRSLHALPLHTLLWADRRPLIRHFAVSYAPNLTTLMRHTDTRRRSRVLFVGVPARAAGLPGPPLEGTAQELTGLKKLYPGNELTEMVGVDATEEKLRELDEHGELDQYGALHFACHGMSIDSDNPMESKLLLYDSDLDGLDISGWKLSTDVVVLSACSAGQRPVFGRGLKELPGDELFGLQAAFIAAGASRVLATQWPVRDDVAPVICGAFHESWRQLPADIALQRSVCRYLDAHGRSMERSPHTWGGFFLTTARMPEPTTAFART